MQRRIYSKTTGVPRTTFRVATKGTGLTQLNQNDKNAVDKFKYDVDREFSRVGSLEDLDDMFDEFNKRINTFKRQKNNEYKRYLKAGSTAGLISYPSTMSSAIKTLTNIDDIAEVAAQTARHFDIKKIGGFKVPEADKNVVDDLLGFFPTVSPYSYVKPIYNVLNLEEPVKMMSDHLSDRYNDAKTRIINDKLSRV
jgi:hypothetical protein